MWDDCDLRQVYVVGVRVCGCSFLGGWEMSLKVLFRLNRMESKHFHEDLTVVVRTF
jgi:hypothetical protein